VSSRFNIYRPTGAAPASLIPVVAVVFICGLLDVLINEYSLFIIIILISPKFSNVAAVFLEHSNVYNST